MTMVDVKKLNSGCANDFHLDMSFFLIHHEKQFIKDIKMNDGRILRATLCWTDYCETKKNFAGQSSRVPTGEVIVSIHFNIWSDDGDFMRSYGLGYWKEIGEPVKRRSAKTLQKFTEKYDEEECYRLYEELESTQVNMFA